MSHDAQFADHKDCPYHTRDENAVQAAAEHHAMREYDSKGPGFADWFTNDWSIDNPEALLELVTLAAGAPHQVAIATGIAQSIKDDWVQNCVANQ